MMSQTSVSLDSLDHAILAILQAEGRLGVTEVGRRINRSQPACLEHFTQVPEVVGVHRLTAGRCGPGGVGGLRSGYAGGRIRGAVSSACG